MSLDSSAGDAQRREWFAVLAHELRSPLGAILGFEELLSEGIAGSVDERGRDSLARIRSSARHLAHLVEGLSDLTTGSGGGAGQLAPVDTNALLQASLDGIRLEADAYAVTLLPDIAPDLPAIHADAERLSRALQLAIAAGIKATAGGTLRIDARTIERSLVIDIAGTHISADRDDPEKANDRLSGAALRFAMARSALRHAAGSLQLRDAADGGTITLRIPAARD